MSGQSKDSGRKRISVSLIKDIIQSRAGRDFYVFDTEVPGFGIRVRRSGSMTYFVQYRYGTGRRAPVRRVKIAVVGTISPDVARDKAKSILASVLSGKDPSDEKKAYKNAPTVRELIDDYLKFVSANNKPKTYESYRHFLRNYLEKKHGAINCNDLTTKNMSDLHVALQDKKVTANKVLNITNTMFRWAIHKEITNNNPCVGIKKYKETKRERFLTSEELQRLGDAIKKAETDGLPWDPDPRKKVKHAPKPENRVVRVESDIADCIRLYVVTGARRGELLRLTWDMVDLERGLLHLPDSKTGKKTIILNVVAIAIFARLPRVSRYVFPGKPKILPDGTRQDRPRTDLKRPWSRIRRFAGLEASLDDPDARVRIHDLRHTFASFGVSMNVGLPIIGRLLTQDDSRSTERYSHLQTDPVRGASDAIAKRITSAFDRDLHAEFEEDLGDDSAEVRMLRRENRRLLEMLKKTQRRTDEG